MLVKINVHVFAYYQNACPAYRIWVNDTLYNERDFWPDWKFNFIEEELYVDLDPGEHKIILEKVVSGETNKIWIEKVVFEYTNNTVVAEFPPEPQDKQIVKFKI